MPHRRYTDTDARDEIEHTLTRSDWPANSRRWYAAWGIAYEWRLANVRAFRDAVFAMLDDQTLTRRLMRGKVAELANRLERHGIEAEDREEGR